MNLEKINSLLATNKVILFMKGDKILPQCGYSRSACEILSSYDIEFATYDVLQDPELREDLKKFANWPTFPQLYINGNLIGGCDIIKEMHEDQELLNVLTS